MVAIPIIRGAAWYNSNNNDCDDSGEDDSY